HVRPQGQPFGPLPLVVGNRRRNSRRLCARASSGVGKELATSPPRLSPCPKKVAPTRPPAVAIGARRVGRNPEGELPLGEVSGAADGCLSSQARRFLVRDELLPQELQPTNQAITEIGLPRARRHPSGTFLP